MDSDSPIFGKQRNPHRIAARQGSPMQVPVSMSGKGLVVDDMPSSKRISSLVLATVAILLIGAGCGNQQSASNSKQGEALDDAKAYHAIYESEKPVLVEFTATWSEPSTRFQPTMQDMKAEYEGVIKFIKVDIDKAPETMQLFECKDVPSLCLVSKKCKHGKLLGGFHEKPEVEEFIKTSFAECNQ